MNKARIASQLQIWFAAGGPLAALIIQETGISPDRYNTWVTAAIAILPGLVSGVWAWWVNREAAQIKAVGELPSVAKVVVGDEVNGSIGAMARCPSNSNIVTETQNRHEVMTGQGR